MDRIVLQTTMILGVFVFFTFIFVLLKKSLLSVKHALLWLGTSAAMLILAFFPKILTHIANTLGFEIPANALFTLLIGFMITLLLQQSVIASKQSEQIKLLAQANAILEKKVRDAEKNRK